MTTADTVPLPAAEPPGPEPRPPEPGLPELAPEPGRTAEPAPFQITYRPALPSQGPGRFLRQVVGVSEDIMDWIPEERARYSRLGAIVLNTGTMAALSLLTALTKITGAPWVALVPIAVFWGYLIVSFDSWVISSTHGKSGRSRLGMAIPRLSIAVLMGIVIAEPLLLWVFGPAIHTEVLAERQTQVTTYESQLQKCNPVSGSVNTAACKNLRLTVKDSPDALATQLSQTTGEQAALQKVVDQINATLAQKEALANAECTGKAGPDTTGQAGDGPECLRDRQVADQYRTDSQLDKHQADLTALNQKVVDQTHQLALARQNYGTELNAAISAKVRAKQASQGRIGILDEDAALSRLSARNGTVFAAQWLFRLLLVVIDCLPVLTKLLAGSSRYDSLVSRQLEVGRRLHDKNLTLRERQDATVSEVGLRQAEYEQRMRLDNLTEADRSRQAAQEADQLAAIDALADRLRARGEPSGVA